MSTSKKRIDQIRERLSLEIVKCERESLRNFRIDEKNYFQDNLWDFNDYNKDNREKYNYRYEFDKVPPSFIVGTKFMILHGLTHKRLKATTLRKRFEAMVTITNYYQELGIDDVRLIDVKYLKDYFEGSIIDLDNDTKRLRANVFIKFLRYHKKHIKYNTVTLIKYLEEFLKKTPAQKRTTSVNQYIPPKLFNQVCALAIRDLNNENLNLRHRITAGLIIIIAETGMRGEELTLLETNRLKTIEVDEKQIHYLEFYTFKITGHGEEKVLTETFLTELASYAYSKVCELRATIIENLSEMSKLRLMVQIKESEEVVGRKKVTELRRIVAEYSDKEKMQIEKEMNRYLFISYQTGLQKRGEKLFSNNMQEFFVRNAEKFAELELTEEEREEYSCIILTSESKYKKFFLEEQREIYPFEEIKHKKYIWINPHAFRVYVCTQLFLKGIHLDFVQKHMNHLSPDMTLYYNKSAEVEEQLGESIKLLSSETNDDGTIKTNIEEVSHPVLREGLKEEPFKRNIEAINEFILTNRLSIDVDLKRILERMRKKDAIIVENEIGLCILAITQQVCRKSEYFSTLDDQYYMEATLQTYKNVGISYRRFKQKVQVIDHNRKVAKSKPQYQNEYEREVNALRHFINKKFLVELDLLEEDIEEMDQEELIEQYPDLEMIIKNYAIIRAEVEPWIK